MNKKLPSIAQSNAITESRYDFNMLEKRALYCIIRKVREDYVENATEQSVYTNMRMTISENVLAEISDEKHRKDAKDALISLRHRDILIEYPDGSWMNTGFVTMAKYDAKTQVFTVEVSSEIMPFLVDLASKFTVLSLTVVISFKSKWTQRFYELCCQYKNHIEKGLPTFHKSIGQLRTMFALEDKYPKLPDFKSRVIDKAQSEMKKSFDEGVSDVWFEYIQTGKGDKSEFKFIVHTKEATEAQKKEFKELRDMAYDIYKTLMSIISNDPDFCEKCWHHLDFFPEKIEPIYQKLGRILKNYKGQDRAKVTRFMLEEDFGMNKKSLPKKSKS